MGGMEGRGGKEEMVGEEGRDGGWGVRRGGEGVRERGKEGGRMCYK